ncbi:MAG: peptidase M49, partial [Deltaproteobacteria bacterium]|nr:peptidase M49 [Deltaproteobacteria bacterium]
LRGFRERYPLNSRVVRGQDGRITELVYRAGDDQTPEGLYAAELRGVIWHLAAASLLAPEAQRTYWSHLIRYFRTGDPQAFRDYNIGWVRDDPAVDAILGFIESYADARGAKGSWEGITFYRNDQRTGMMRSVAQNAQYFEERTPWEPRFRRTEFRPLVAASVDILVETGDGGPVSAAGINLPNEQAIRQQHGSRNFFLSNVMEAGDRAVGQVSIREFAASEAEAAESARCEGAFYDAVVALHEVTGHASGRVAPDLRGDPHEHLRQYYSTLEEARADLVALWHMADPKVLELGLLPDAACVAAGYRLFAAGFLSSLRRYPDEATLEEDHDRARSLIVRYAMDRGAVRAEQREGHWYLSVPDPDAFRQAVGQLLAELQRIKGTGDFDAIRTLVERFGAPIEDAWRDDAIARAQRIGLPTNFAYVSPRLVADRDPQGRITDVRVERPESFLSLMLEWSAQGRQSAQDGRGMTAIR